MKSINIQRWKSYVYLVACKRLFIDRLIKEFECEYPLQFFPCNILTSNDSSKSIDLAHKGSEVKKDFRKGCVFSFLKMREEEVNEGNRIDEN